LQVLFLETDYLNQIM